MHTRLASDTAGKVLGLTVSQSLNISSTALRQFWHSICLNSYGMNDSKEIGIPDRRQSLIRGILQYLVAHPDAKDTREGIQSWWLPGHTVEWEQTEVQEVLNHLVAKRWLRKRNLPPLRDLYCLNNERLGEIKAYLQTPGSK